MLTLLLLVDSASRPSTSPRPTKQGRVCFVISLYYQQLSGGVVFDSLVDLGS